MQFSQILDKFQIHMKSQFDYLKPQDVGSKVLPTRIKYPLTVDHLTPSLALFRGYKYLLRFSDILHIPASLASNQRILCPIIRFALRTCQNRSYNYTDLGLHVIFSILKVICLPRTDLDIRKKKEKGYIFITFSILKL